MSAVAAGSDSVPLRHGRIENTSIAMDDESTEKNAMSTSNNDVLSLLSVDPCTGSRPHRGLHRLGGTVVDAAAVSASIWTCIIIIIVRERESHMYREGSKRAGESLK